MAPTEEGLTLVFSNFTKMEFGSLSYNSETMGEFLLASAPLLPLLRSPISVFTGCSNPLLGELHFHMQV